MLIYEIFCEIAECLTAEQLEKIKDNFIFISPAFGKEEAFNKIHLHGEVIRLSSMSLYWKIMGLYIKPYHKSRAQCQLS